MGEGVFYGGAVSAVRAWRHWALATVLALLALLALSAPASADMTFCAPGSGAGQCNALDAVAVDEETAVVYTIDTGNRRVDVFAEDGSFVRAFGWDVIPSGAPGDTGTGLEVCTTATGCKAGSEGSGAGQFKGNGPNAIAVDNDPSSLSQHAVYVVDLDNFRVQKFTPTGEFVWMIGGGVNKGGGTPANPGNLCTAEHLANGDICGAGANGKGTGEFEGRRIFVSIGPGGLVHVADGPPKGASELDGFDNRVQKFAADGTFLDEVALPELTVKEVRAFAVDRTSGDCYVNERGGLVHRYFACENLLAPETFPKLSAGALAVDGEGNLFAAPSATNTDIYQYDSSGAPVRTFYGNGTLVEPPISLAPHSSATGDIFVVEESDPPSPRRLAHIAFPPPGPVVLDAEAQPVGSVRATFRARVNPEGETTEVHFEYVDDATYQVSGFAEAKRTPEETAEDPSIPPDSGKWVAHEASVALACPEPESELAEDKCLQAETVYHLRAVAENASGEDTGPEASFETQPPIQLGPTWSTVVGSESARLHAELDPTGVPASVRFEYVDQASFEESGFDDATVTPEVDFGTGEGMTSRSILIHSLTEDTTYHFRYFATNFFDEFEGPEVRSFTTLVEALPPKTDCANQAFRIGAAASLPDCRAYELVSPLDKGNGDVLPAGKGSRQGVPTEQAASGGDALAYVSSRAFGDAVSSPFFSQYLARRDPEAGWSSNSLDPPLGGSNLYAGVFGRPVFKGFSEDLCSGWLTQNTELALVPGAPEGVPNFYRRRNCGGDPYELLTTVAPPGFSREGEEGTNESEGDLGSHYYPGVGGWSHDGELSVFKAGAALTAEARTVGVGKLLSCDLAAASTPGASIAYQWLRNGAPIAGLAEKVKTAQYTTVNADKGKAIQCRTIATNEEEDENSGDKAGAVAFSGPAMVVAPPPEVQPPLAPTFIPAPEASAPLLPGGPGGQTLSCDPREASWKDGPTAFAYQWQRNGIPIAGATAQTYVISAEDLATAAAFQCVVTASNTGGAVSKESANVVTSGPGPEPAPPRPRAFVLDIYRVYAKKGSELSLVSVLPSGEAAHTHASVGTRARDGASDGNATDSVLGAVSTDGSRIFFSAATQEPPQPIHQNQDVLVPRGSAGASRLYLRLNPMEPQSEVEEVAGEFHCTEAEKACTVAISKGVARFLGADPEADKVLFSEGEALYELDVEKAIAYEAGAATQIAGDVMGVLGASEDTSRVYLVSEALCSGAATNSEGEAAQAGEPNLYLYETGQSCGAGEMTFVAGLGEDDVTGGDGLLVIDPEPFRRRSRVSGDGLHATFMSRARLSDYDNTDAGGSGEPAAEVFLYDAAEAELRCASCNPSGARPQGENVGTTLLPVWVAAQIPGWATQWHPSRVLSADGSHLFFESFEGLVPRDGNGKLDVYQWQEAHGKAECIAAGAERYVQASEGCLSLISSGTSAGDAEFLDASASGSDVFFRTASSLIGADYGLVDIYDARVGGGFEEGEEEKKECEGEACQSPPAPPARQTPSSAVFEGEGDMPNTRRSCPKGKRRVRRGGKTRCVRKQRSAKRNRKGRRSRR